METSAFTPEVMSIALSVMEGLSSVRSLTVAILIRHHEWGQLATLRCDPNSYEDSDDYWRDCMATDLFRKCEDFSDERSLREKAVKLFEASEHQCLRANLRLTPYLFGTSHEAADMGICDFVSRVQKVVLSWIGSGPPSDIQGRFGPGATMSDQYGATTVPDKISSSPTLTASALGWLFPWSGTYWASTQVALAQTPQFIRGNSFFTVPKDANSVRGCAKEPSLNGFYQLGVGSVLKQYLLRIGFDMRRGSDHHQRLAQLGSLSGEFCTIDLSSASDTVCRVLVKLFLPRRWHELLDDLRSPTTQVDGRTVVLEKFSSMGNGFTFELETLLFAAISHVACDERTIPGTDLLVYGDDIICPVDNCKDVLAALRFFGFTPNKRKTFESGWFRESCGGDYFKGSRVRPHYIEKLPTTPEMWISLANGLRRSCFNGFRLLPRRWSRLRASWFKVLDQIPTAIRNCRGPEDLGDSVIHDESIRWVASLRVRSSILYLRAYVPVGFRRKRWSDFVPEAQFAAALYGVHRDFMGNLIPRDSVTGYAIKWVSRS